MSGDRRRVRSSLSSNSLSSKRLTTANGGRPAITVPETVIRRHAQFACGLSGEKAPLAYFTIGFHFLGNVPSKTDVMSPVIARHRILQLKLADNAFHALELNRTLVNNPFAAISFCYDATVEGEDCRQSAFMRAPNQDPDNLGAFPTLRSIFLGFNVAPSKGAKSNAEMTLYLTKEWSKSVPGLFERILIAFCWSVVDHAALAETAELDKLATKHLDKHFEETSQSLASYVGEEFAEIIRTSGGDSFHKTSLAAIAAEKGSFGQKRGAKGNDVYSPHQVCLDAHYYESKDRSNKATRLKAWCGKTVPIQQGIVKERWESVGKVFMQAGGRTKTKSTNHMNKHVYPDYHIEELKLDPYGGASCKESQKRRRGTRSRGVRHERRRVGIAA
mmetsp:Transcript_3500/g.7457  ORF Transcript_3500/g.7457 Transcript_3500/m.7457 type:complete len:388 (+) Transcript_3500:2-1165(+)